MAGVLTASELTSLWPSPAASADLDRLTQVVPGEPVLVVGRAPAATRVEVVLPWQPSSLDPRGYPGWVETSALVPGSAVGPGTGPGKPHRADPRPVPAIAADHLGTAYLWGGLSQAGIDCSGLVHLAARRAGLVVPRDAHDQHHALPGVPLDQVRPGDLLFFAPAPDATITHVGLATTAAPGTAPRMLHAPQTGAVVVEEPLDEHRRATLVAAARLAPCALG